jgi:streptogramin lyase
VSIDIFVADVGNAAVRQIVPRSPRGWTVSTLYQTNGSDGFGLQALTAAPDGTLYAITETSDFHIHRVNLDGTITLIATQAGARGENMCVDPTNTYIFVSDWANDCIYRVTIADGTVTMIAGDGVNPGYVNGAGADARFKNPLGMCFGPDGALYVADRSNFALRRIDVSTFEVSTVVGDSGRDDIPGGLHNIRDGDAQQAMLYEPNDVCLHGGKLYILVLARPAIREYDPATDTVSTIAYNYAYERGWSNSVAPEETPRTDFDPPYKHPRPNPVYARGVQLSTGAPYYDFFDPPQYQHANEGGDTGWLPFYRPAGLCVTANGYFIVTDAYASCLTGVSMAGEIEPFVGGNAYTADSGLVDGPAWEAQLDFPLNACIVGDDPIVIAEPAGFGGTPARAQAAAASPATRVRRRHRTRTRGTLPPAFRPSLPPPPPAL